MSPDIKKSAIIAFVCQEMTVFCFWVLKVFPGTDFDLTGVIMSGIQIKIYPAGQGRQIYRVIAVNPKKATFEDLCYYLLYTFDLYDYMFHMYRFVFGRKLYGQRSPEIERNGRDMKRTIGSVVLPKSFLFHYDYIVDRAFVITIMKNPYKGVIDAESGIIELKSVGEYQAYPDYDDDEDEENEENEKNEKE